MFDELVGALPTWSQSSYFPWLLHLYHRLAYNQAFKQMLTSFGSIDFLLLLLSLLHIEQNVVMDACNELHFLQKLSCSSFHINTIVGLNSQGLQVVVCPQTWCSTSEDHERREFCIRLDPTSVPKQNLSQLLIPIIHVGRSSNKHSYAMLDGLNHALSHPIALRPLGCSALVLNSIVPTHHVELYSPPPPHCQLTRIWELHIYKLSHPPKTWLPSSLHGQQPPLLRTTSNSGRWPPKYICCPT